MDMQFFRKKILKNDEFVCLKFGVLKHSKLENADCLTLKLFIPIDSPISEFSSNMKRMGHDMV